MPKKQTKKKKVIVNLTYTERQINYMTDSLILLEDILKELKKKGNV